MVTHGFTAPSLLLLLLGAALLLAGRGQGGGARRVLRFLAVAVLLLAAAGPYRESPARPPVRWIFLEDVSDSVGGRGRAAVRAREEGLLAATAGAAAVRLRFARGLALDPEAPDPPGDASDPVPALRRAAALLRPDRVNRVVLFTDGRLSRPPHPADWPPGLPPLYLASPPRDPRPDPRALALRLPRAPAAGAPWEAVVRYRSDGPTVGTLTVTVAGHVQHLPLRWTAPGDRRQVVSLPPLAPGRYRLEVRLAAAPDREPGNNRLVGELVLPPPKPVAVALPSGGTAGFLELLPAHGIPLTTLAAGAAALPEAAVVVLPAGSTPPRPGLLAALSRAVARGETGLLFLGGQGPPDLTAWRRTVLEPLLPLEPEELAPPPPPRRRPPAPRRPAVRPVRGPGATVTLVLLLDKSGSMGAGPPGRTPLDFAREAALATARTLSPADRLAIVAFDHRDPILLLPPSPPPPAAELRRRLEALRAEGGTRFLPPLTLARRLLAGDPGRLKHVLLLTDGQRLDVERYRDAEFRTLVEHLRARRATLSAVAVGPEADAKFLAFLARYGGGNVFLAERPEEIPQVFLAETDRLLARAGRRGRARKVPPRDVPTPHRRPPSPKRSRAAPAPVALRPAAPHPVVQGVHTPPPLRRVHPCRRRPGSWVAWATEAGAPVLATRPYGLGQVGLLATDLAGAWSAPWRSWRELPRFVVQLVRFLAPRLPPPTPPPRDGRVHGPELDATGPDPAGLARLRERLRARPLPPAAGGPWPGEPAGRRRVPLAPYLLLAALLLLFLELLHRRLHPAP